MNSLKLEKPRLIDKALPANLSCGKTLEAGHGTEKNFSMTELHHVLNCSKPSVVVVDVRTPQEYAAGHVPKSFNIPMGEEIGHIEELVKREKVYLYCNSGRRAQTVYTLLAKQGLTNLVCISSSGIKEWISSGLPVHYGS
ncbi:MAG: rhodanese-like domain-containing protein [SAR324 cluster bacterium]|nr:rhodanese-like domain-containing protein [SAR324 cluster bacterium]